MLEEELRLVEEREKEDKQLPLNDLNQKENEIKLENLLAILENSNKISSIFESRIVERKKQIINETSKTSKDYLLKKGIKSKNIVPEDQSNEETNNEENYLSLFQQPKLFNGQLKNHQIEGLIWIRTLFENGLNGILADDMGLGKTIQTIAFYCFLIEMGVVGPFLVVAPLSTIPNWLSELTRFSPQLCTVLYHGTAKERKKIQSTIKKTNKINDLLCYPVVVTTYDVLRADIKILINYDWKFITIDEGHKLKNVNSLISNCMRQFKCSNKLLLTGTPIQNDVSELWALLNLLMPNLFDKLEDFNAWFGIENFFESNDKIAVMAKNNEILDIMLKVIKPFILRREKKETDLNLPKKKEIVIYAPITELQQELYKATLNKQMEILLNKTKETDDTIHEALPKRKCVTRIDKYTTFHAILNNEPEVEIKPKDVAISVVMQNPFMQLKKIANHPYLVHMPLIPGTKEILVDENIIKASGKLQVLDAMLTKLKLLGHKVLLFSTMTQLLDIIEEFLIYRSYKYTRLDGTMTIETRVKNLKNFTNDAEYFLMIISTRAGGLGLNLTAADTVILFDSDWNPQVDMQAQDRCHRMGQDKPVVVYRLCSKNTVDENILDCAGAKKKLEKLIMGNGSFNRASKLNITEVEDLMKLLESSDYTTKIHSNGFILTDEELEALLDRSDMIDESIPKSNTQTKSAVHFKELTNT